MNPAITVRLLGPEDGDACLAVSRACPIEADFVFRFDRDPDFFAWPRQVFDGYRYAGAFAGDRLVAYAMVGLREGWIGEGWGRYAYPADARVLPAHRGRGVMRQLGRLLTAQLPDDVRLAVGLVKQGNVAGEGLAAAMPAPGWRFEPAGTFEASNLLCVRPWRVSPLARSVRPARVEEASAIAELFESASHGRLFAPRSTAEWVASRWQTRSAGVAPFHVLDGAPGLRGAVGLVDLDPVRRTTILRYAWRGRLAKAGWGALQLLGRGLPSLPPPGGALRALTLVGPAVRDGDPAVLQALLEHVVGECAGRGLHLLHTGFVVGDPLADGLRGLPRVGFRSNLIIGRRDLTGPHSGGPVWLDLPML